MVMAHYQHNGVGIYFDSYFTDFDRSSDASSNAGMFKYQDELQFLYDNGISQGSTIPWHTGFVLDLLDGDFYIGNPFEAGPTGGYRAFFYVSGTALGNGSPLADHTLSVYDRGNPAKPTGPLLRIHDQGGLTLTDMSSAPPNIASGRSAFWVKDDAPNVPKFTDDTNTTYQLAYTSSIITDHTALNNLFWTGSNHTGTANYLASFDGSGNPTTVDPATVGTTDHTSLNNIFWTGSNHTGTANYLASFDGSGNPTTIDPATVGVTDHTLLTNLAWTGSNHTGSSGSIAGFTGLGVATEYFIGTDIQGYHPFLADITASNPSQDQILGFDGTQWVATSSGGGGGGVSDHTALTNLAWTGSNHTGSANTLAAFSQTGSAILETYGSTPGNSYIVQALTSSKIDTEWINYDDVTITNTSDELAVKVGGIAENYLGFSWVTEIIPAASFVYTSPSSSYTLSSAASANPNVLDMATLYRNGVNDQTRVTSPSANEEWKIVGTTLAVYGDVTSSSDTYKVTYVAGGAPGDFASGISVAQYQEQISIATVSGTVNHYGWVPEGKVKRLKNIEVYSKNLANTGSYTFTLTKDPEGTDRNMIFSASIDLTDSGPLTAGVPYGVLLTTTSSDFTLSSSQTWRASFDATSASNGASGVYMSLNWEWIDVEPFKNLYQESHPVSTISGTVEHYGWVPPGKSKILKSVEVYSYATASVGDYTFTLTKDPGGTNRNMIFSASIDLSTSGPLTNEVPYAVDLTNTGSDLTLSSSQTWLASFDATSASNGAEGVYFSLTWEWE
jgi:hypothetical protein